MSEQRKAITMILNIRVTPNAKENKIFEEACKLKVYITSPAQDGKANKALFELLSKHFSVKKSSIRILKGEKSRDKIVEITS